MQCVANYEIKSELSVFEDEKWLKIRHPKGLFAARLRNIAREDYSTPFLLTLHLTFDAPSLDEAKEIAEERLVDCLNMLSLATGSRFQRHRIRQIVDTTPGVSMRDILMWADTIGHEDPFPRLEQGIIDSIERLLDAEISPALKRAMRWYRLGINSTIPDDQFQYFWFALEILALAQKSPGKIQSLCTTCKSPLYCATCEKHPVHKLFPGEKIRELIKAANKECDDAKIAMLEKARNSLMHGRTLKEIEANLPQPREEIVDVLGHIILIALIHQFPREIFAGGRIAFLSPSTYVHRTVSGITHMQMPVPIDDDGELDLSFSGTTITMTTDGPPQSARPTLVGMTLEQFQKLTRITYAKGDHQEMLKRIHQRSDQHGENVAVGILATDFKLILHAVKSGESGEWQDLFREILGESQGT